MPTVVEDLIALAALLRRDPPTDRRPPTRPLGLELEPEDADRLEQVRRRRRQVAAHLERRGLRVNLRKYGTPPTAAETLERAG